MLFHEIILYLLMQVKVNVKGRFYVTQDGRNYSVHGMMDTGPVANETTKEVKSMELYHYLVKQIKTIRTRKGPKDIVVITRIVTTDLPASLETAYTESIKTGGPVVTALCTDCMTVQVVSEEMLRKQFTCSSCNGHNCNSINRIYAVKMGVYHFPFIERVVGERGFTLASVAMRTVGKLGWNYIQSMVGKSTFSYSNASTAYFLRVNETDEYGLEQFGITARHLKKLVKRLAELTRMSKIGLWTTADTVKVHKYNRPDFLPEEYVDGKIAISRSFAARIYSTISDTRDAVDNVSAIWAGEKVEVIFRAILDGYTLKGNAFIVPDEQLRFGTEQFDISADSSAFKKEFGFDPDGPLGGQFFVVAWDYDNLHIAGWDAQTTSNFPQVFSEAEAMADLGHFVTTIRDRIYEGEIPKFIQYTPDAHGDDGVPDVDQLSELFMANHQRWGAHNLDIRLAQNLMYMSLNGLIMRMEGEESNRKNGWFKRTWLPMTNACIMSVVTREFCELLAGYKFPEHPDRNECFYDKRVGFVLPGKRFLETFALHDGWDQDDTMKCRLVKVWTSNEDILAIHRDHHSVPENSYIPSTADEARIMVLGIRTPNAPGGWAIEEFDISTWPGDPDLTDLDNIQVLDLAIMPPPLEYQLQRITVGALKATTVYTGKALTKAESEAMILAQTVNPGVGRFVNPLIAWSTMFGGYCYPPLMPCTLNDAVDSMQQGADQGEFSDLESGIVDMTALVIGQSQITPADTATVLTRFSDDVIDMINHAPGETTRFQIAYKDAIKTLKKELRDYSLQLRNMQPLAQRIIHDESIPAGGEQFIQNWTLEFRRSDAQYEAAMKWAMDPFAKAMARLERKERMTAIVEKMLEGVNTWGDKRNERVLSIWKSLMLPTKAMPLSRPDRLIFQPGAKGEKCLMDILIEALEERGWAS